MANQGQDYYERYWTGEGFNPTGNGSPELNATLDGLVRRGTPWLDLGCGDALTSGPALVERGARYTGVDISAAAVGQQARRNGYDARVIEDAGELPFADDSFDGVVCVEVFEHLFDPRGTAAEIHGSCARAVTCSLRSPTPPTGGDERSSRSPAASTQSGTTSPSASRGAIRTSGSSPRRP